MKFVFLFLILFALSCSASSEERGVVVGKHTFQAPFLFGITSSIPYWEYGASAVATESFIRLVPAIRSRIGWIWNTEPVKLKAWSVTMEFNIHNIESPGADGMAFWYSKHPKQTGSLWGQAEDFEGLGIIFDTYDNNGDGDTPSIIAIKGNGHYVNWDYDNDLRANQLDRCKADFRNPINDKVRVKIIYERNTLQVLIDSLGNGDYAFCLAVDNLHLPEGYYFGVTAATGGLADYHDIYSFVTRDLTPSAKLESEQYNERKGWWDPYKYYQEVMEKEEAEKQKQQEELEAKQREEELRKQEEFFKQLQEERKKLQEEHYKKFEGYKDKLSKDESSLLLLEALEQVSKHLESSSTKSDVNAIIERVQSISNQQSDVQVKLNELRKAIQQEVQQVVGSLKEETNHLARGIKQLETILSTLNIHVDKISEKQSQFDTEFKKSTEYVRKDIQDRSSSMGFWTYFILFQIVFTAGIIYYRKYRDVKNAKIF